MVSPPRPFIRISEHVVPRPTDWPDTTLATGYWFLDRQDDWQPPADLAGLSWMLVRRPCTSASAAWPGGMPPEKRQAAIGALQKSGQRGMIATGWGGLSCGRSAGWHLQDRRRAARLAV